MSKAKVFDYSLSCKDCFSRIHERRFGGESCLDGDVVTPHGIVSVYSQGDGNHIHHTRLDMAMNGRLHVRNIRRRYSKRGLVTLARRFAEELAATEIGREK